jgi:hypothetical protein
MSQDRHAILSLMNEYCFCVDTGNFDGFAALFEHGSFHVLGDPAGAQFGTTAVRAVLDNVTLYEGKPQTKHVMSNVQIDVDDSGNHATAQSYISLFQGLPDFPPQAIFMGHYFDTFNKVDDVWRFDKREISPDLIGDLSRHRSDMA